MTTPDNETAISPDSAPAPPPLRSVHTAGRPELLRQLGVTLLVSTYRAGKLVIVREDGGRRRPQAPAGRPARRLFTSSAEPHRRRRSGPRDGIEYALPPLAHAVRNQLGLMFACPRSSVQPAEWRRRPLGARVNLPAARISARNRWTSSTA
jgi:hypothetical protein